MSLINCPECNKEVSDKATACPHCGNPMNSVVIPKSDLAAHEVDKKEYIFCPKCLSTHVHSEQKGFSGGKALVGAVIAGPLGLLAGTIGSKKVKFTCQKCGYNFMAGEAFIATHKKKNEIIESCEKRMLEKGTYSAVDYLREEMNWSLIQSQTFCDLYLKSHNDFRLKYEEEENKRNGSKSVVGIILPYLVTLLIILFVSYTLVDEVSDYNWGIGSYITFIVVLLVSVCSCYLAAKDEISKLERRNKDFK